MRFAPANDSLIGGNLHQSRKRAFFRSGRKRVIKSIPDSRSIRSRADGWHGDRFAQGHTELSHADYEWFNLSDL